ncbi:TlpA family protein disulfide reductase [Streptomyces sp. NPDC014776]|uniref:TlpA family protein disulfide reductase n=1 Tax=Streptomyces sp. NPDC014776 TaxID=3364909 RepID=UPI0036FBDE1E
MHSGLLHHQAADLRVADWIDSAGTPLATPLRLADLGCHSQGFPTLQVLHDNLARRGVGFAAIQTVFEGADVNTFDKLRINQEKYSLAIPFGHDLPAPGQRNPTFMEDYRSGGTPWFTVIDPNDKVVYADFHFDPRYLIDALKEEPGDPRE